MNYMTSAEIRRMFKISSVTLMNWKNEGRIKFKKLSNRKFLYDADSIDSMSDVDKSNCNKKNVIYARVSNKSQKHDLENQIETIKNYMLNNGVKFDEIYSDIASGMNENRKQFNELLESIFKREISTVYITFKDRLSRFGFNYFKRIFAFFGTEIIILDEKEETNKTYQQELCEDLISIIHTYSMKIYRERKNKLKQIENILASSENDTDEKE